MQQALVLDLMAIVPVLGRQLSQAFDRMCVRGKRILADLVAFDAQFRIFERIRLGRKCMQPFQIVGLHTEVTGLALCLTGVRGRQRPGHKKVSGLIAPERKRHQSNDQRHRPDCQLFSAGSEAWNRDTGLKLLTALSIRQRTGVTRPAVIWSAPALPAPVFEGRLAHVADLTAAGGGRAE